MVDSQLLHFAREIKRRGPELVKISLGDLVSGTEIMNMSIGIQQKAGRPVLFELAADVRASWFTWLGRIGSTVHDYVFKPRRPHGASKPSSASDIFLSQSQQETAIAGKMAAARSAIRHPGPST